MPTLASTDAHVCCLCRQSFSKRSDLKTHHIKLKKNKKPRCAGLKKVIPRDVWESQILPHYVADAKLPDLSGYAKVKKSPGKKTLKAKSAFSSRCCTKAV